MKKISDNLLKGVGFFYLVLFVALCAFAAGKVSKPDIADDPVSYIAVEQCRQQFVGVFIFSDGRQVRLDPTQMTVDEANDWYDKIPIERRVTYDLGCNQHV